MIVTSRVKIDILTPENPPVVHVVQDDKYSRNLELTLFKGGVVCLLSSDIAAVVKFSKPDGTGGTYDKLPDGTDACSISGNAVTIALAPQVCTVPGVVRLSVGLVDGDTILHTFPVRIDVVANPALQTSSQNYYKISGALADSGWTPNKYLGTDADGNVVVKDAPAGSGATVTEEQVQTAVNTYLEANPVTGGATDTQVANAVSVYMANNPIETGATEEEAAQIQTNKENIEDIQDTIADMQQGIANIAVVEGETTTTFTETMKDGSTFVVAVNFDDTDTPTSCVVNGETISVEWSTS